MLILTRQLNEAIIIAGNIRVTVVRIDGNRVKLAIDAPSDVSVNREEVEERIDKDN
tara:strand:- start:477 stop:644 length:168 start_codon:yes stop_codon:yes gene_type:complete